MSRRDRILLTILVPVAALAAFWMLALSPKLKDMHAAEGDVTTAKAALVAADAKVAQQQASRVTLRRQRADVAAAYRAVPTTSQMPNLLRQLQRTARRSGVAIDTVSPATASATATAGVIPGVDTATLTVSFHGSYHNTQRFLRLLGQAVRVTPKRVRASGRALSISTVQLNQDETGKRLQGTLTASTYKLQSGAALAAAAAAAAATPAVGAAATPTAPAGGSS